MLVSLMRKSVLGQTKKLAYPVSLWMAKSDALKRLAGQGGMKWYALKGCLSLQQFGV